MLGRFGPFTGERNSSAGAVLFAVKYGSMSAVATGTSVGRVQPLTKYGPLTPTALVWASQPSTLAMNARNCFAASLCSLVAARYTPADSHVVNPFELALAPGMAKKPTSLALS